MTNVPAGPTLPMKTYKQLTRKESTYHAKKYS
jgi:hypothetical protein